MHVLAITTVFVVLATLTVGLRLFTRFYLVKSPGLDDVFITAALAANLVYYALVLVQRNYGLGADDTSLSQDTIQGQLYVRRTSPKSRPQLTHSQYLWIAIPFYNLALILAKISALLLFTRLFRSRLLVRASYAMIAFLVLAGLWMVFSGFFFCVPVHYFWTRKDGDDHCLPQGPIWLLNAGIHIATDVIILILPMPAIWKTQIPKRLKAGIITVFGLGVCVIATSSVRLYILNRTVNEDNFTKTNAQASVWSSLEANISIICVCLPPIHPLLSRIFSYCFLPQPLHSSPASRAHSATTNLTERKPSIYDHSSHPDGGVWYNELFTPGPTSYTASISKVNTREEEGDRDGIRVVRELRMQSDTVDLEMAGLSNAGESRSNPSIEWDLGDFEFPDYKERMNAPI
ncbi:unnamed protein product [Penicillium salamii]|uniref:Rhodopsin domain-containing protein n=1 Tax=Penicillium salamii TaxID=1612424 RepID=A0A9W4NFN3_9EURO|nr:unnamed protein product [Penicillium salamii]